MEVRIDQKYWEMMVLQWENPYFGIYYSIAQWARYKLLNAKVRIFSP